MTTPAQQYRALVDKLTAITEAPSDNTPQHNEPPLKIGDIDPRNGKKIIDALVDGSGHVVRSRFGDIWNVKYGPADAPAPAPVAEPTTDPVTTPVADPVTPTTDPVTPPVNDPSSDPVAPADEVKCGPEVQAQIKAQKTFNAAYALAKKSGCPDFDWCQIVNVPGQGPTPSKPEINIGNPMGDLSGGYPGTGWEEGYESDEYVLENELNRIREIAGTQVIEAAGAMPEIKAASKQAAIEIARKKGIKVFRFCGKYKVKDAKRGQGPTPHVPPVQDKPEINIGNPMGDLSGGYPGTGW